jgi:DNA-nicking Smr family endonuclease
MSVDSNDDDEAALFRSAMRGVLPLHATQPRVTARAAAVAKRPKPAPRARFARAERQAVLQESLAKPGPLIETQALDELSFRRPGVPETVLRRLKRGEYRIEAELDLHGLTGTQAAEQLGAFLAYAIHRGLRSLRVIHGKGMRSGPGGPVLKKTVNTLLRRAGPVLCFASAHPKDGGTGATLVLLGKSS